MKNAKINIAPLFYVEFSWHGFMKIVAGTTSIFLLGFPYFRNTLITIETKKFALKFSIALFKHCWQSIFFDTEIEHLSFTWIFPMFFVKNYIHWFFFSCFPKLLNGFKSRNHIGSCLSKAYAKKCDINYVVHWILLLKNRIKTKILF